MRGDEEGIKDREEEEKNTTIDILKVLQYIHLTVIVAMLRG